MNHTEEYNDQELQDMKERCLYMITTIKLQGRSFTTGKDYYNAGWGDIYKIALVEINRELDMRKLREEGTNE